MDLTDTIFALIATIFVIIGITALGQYIYKRYIIKRGNNARERIARDTIAIAMDQRGTMFIDFLSTDLNGLKIEGTCESVRGKDMFIDVTGAFFSNHWKNEKVLIFFQTSFRHKISFFQFYATIKNVQQRGQHHIICVPFPSALEPGQKRSALRITPHKNAILGIGIWPLAHNTPLPTSMSDLPQATISYRPTHNTSLVLENISAGGMSFRLTNYPPLPENITFEKGSRILTLLMLRQADEKSHPLALWIASRILLARHDPSGTWILGLRITHWAAIESNNRPLAWFPLDAEETVAPLATWIIRHHLEQTHTQ